MSHPSYAAFLTVGLMSMHMSLMLWVFWKLEHIGLPEIGNC